MENLLDDHHLSSTSRLRDCQLGRRLISLCFGKLNYRGINGGNLIAI